MSFSAVAVKCMHSSTGMRLHTNNVIGSTVNTGNWESEMGCINGATVLNSRHCDLTVTVLKHKTMRMS